MNDGGPEIVVAMRRRLGVLMLLEEGGVALAADPQLDGEGVRLGDLVERFEIAAAIGEGEGLAPAVRPRDLDGQRRRRQAHRALGADAKAWRHALLEDF